MNEVHVSCRLCPNEIFAERDFIEEMGWIFDDGEPYVIGLCPECGIQDSETTERET